MLFGKKEKNEIIVPKEKLSGLALDHFAQAYSVDKGESPSPHNLPYVTTKREVLTIDGAKTTKNIYKTQEQFCYLLAQTLPYHQPDDLKHAYFHLSDLLLIVNENGQTIPWTKSKADMMQFIKITDFLGLLIPSGFENDDPRNPRFARIPDLKPVIHVDKEHPAPGEE